MSPVGKKQFQRQNLRYREPVLLVQVALGKDILSPPGEMISLIKSAGGLVSHITSQQRSAPDSSFFVGSGKAEEIRLQAENLDLDTIVFDHNLSPGQVSKLEDITGRKVIDRTELILAIFAGQARTKEAKLQIELAQLGYALPRLTGMWHHFSRLGAGIGTRGPGETQLEIDRRRARSRIRHIESQLESIENQQQVRNSRRKWMYSVTLVGYTNAGKSTLLNYFCGSQVHTEDRLFATLDTTSRRLELPDGEGVVLLSDTVGFIERLPETLIASFRTTLGIVRDSDLLIIVADRSDPAREQKLRAVRETLERIGAGMIPTMITWSKCDLLEETTVQGPGVAVSALNGFGTGNLLKRIVEMRDKSLDWFSLTIDNPGEETISWLYRNCLVKKLTRNSGSIEMSGAISMGTDAVDRYLAGEGVTWKLVSEASPFG